MGRAPSGQLLTILNIAQAFALLMMVFSHIKRLHKIPLHGCIIIYLIILLTNSHNVRRIDWLSRDGKPLTLGDNLIAFVFGKIIWSEVGVEDRRETRQHQQKQIGGPCGEFRWEKCEPTHIFTKSYTFSVTHASSKH